jgi:hypothetical protein
VTLSGCERSVSGVSASASAVAATTLAVLGPDALGGAGPVAHPVLGLDLISDTFLGQGSALTAIFMLVWALAQSGVAGQRASVAAAAVSVTLAQPLLDLLNVPVLPASAQLDPSAGWLSAVAVAAVYSLISVGLLVGVDIARSTMTWLAETIVASVRLLVAFFGRSEPLSTPHRCPAPPPPLVLGRTWVREMSRRGPPFARPLAGV